MGFTLSDARKKQFLVANMAIVNFFAFFSYSIITSFFPIVAAERDVSSFSVGIIFGIYEFIIFLTSFPLGSYLPVIGGKFMYTSGLFIEGCCSILMGCLSRCPPGTPFLVMCLLIRCVQAVGSGMTVIASFAIIGEIFPDSVSTVFGTIEMFTAIGFMLGPLLGGILYDYGGYSTPFFTVGGLVLFMFAITVVFMPYKSNISPKQSSQVHKLLKIPSVWLSILSSLCICTSFSFLAPILEPFLYKEFNITPSIGGLIFIASPLGYAITAPFWGWIVDKYRCLDIFTFIGLFNLWLCYTLVGPSPWFNTRKNYLWLTVLGCFIQGFGGGAAYVPIMKSIFDRAIANGLPNNLETTSAVAGATQSIFSLGFFLGPTLSGAMIEPLGFEWSTTIISFYCLFFAVVTLIQLIVMKMTTGRITSAALTEEVDSEETPLMLTSRVSI